MTKCKALTGSAMKGLSLFILLRFSVILQYIALVCRQLNIMQFCTGTHLLAFTQLIDLLSLPQYVYHLQHVCRYRAV